MALTVTTTQTTEVKIEPALRKKLVQKLTAYGTLHAQKKAMEAKLKTLTEELGELRDETGEGSLRLEGHGTITLVAPTRKKFDPKLYVRNGGDLALYNSSVVEVPVKAYTRVTLPGTSDGDDE